MREFESSGQIPDQLLDQASVGSMTELFNVLDAGLTSVYGRGFKFFLPASSARTHSQYFQLRGPRKVLSLCNGHHGNVTDLTFFVLTFEGCSGSDFKGSCAIYCKSNALEAWVLGTDLRCRTQMHKYTKLQEAQGIPPQNSISVVVGPLCMQQNSGR